MFCIIASAILAHEATKVLVTCELLCHIVLPHLCRLPASPGFRAWPFLQSLHLDHNLLSGSLPASWGGDGSMASLKNFTLTYNNFNGSIPAIWASDGIGKRRFPALQSLILQPGVTPYDS